jgi:Oxidoreductase molybdopterin binding domain
MVRPHGSRLTLPVRHLAELVQRPLPAPPVALRRGPLRAGAFPSPLRSRRLTSQLGVWLGIAFAICFLTGLTSHYIQHPPGWFWWPSRPVWLYRVTQGVHVATGFATVPLLGAKLWSVYPRLFTWPPARNLAHAAERASVAVLVAAALFQLVTGVLNVSRWYTAMPFYFTISHYLTAWLAIGALLVHIAVQLPVIRGALSRRSPAPAAEPAAGAGPAPAEPAAGAGPGAGLEAEPAGGLSRRGLLATVGGTAAVITVATVGQTVPVLSPLSVLGPRRPTTGPQRLPVNASAAGAGVTRLATSPDYRLRVTGPAGTRTLSLADLAALPQHTVSLPITCVEGWSADGVWSGVRIADLAALVGVPGGDVQVLVESLQGGGPYRASVLARPHARDPLTLLALRLHGEPLALDHGFPARLIAPNRPGVMQTKWVTAVTVGRA